MSEGPQASPCRFTGTRVARERGQHATATGLGPLLPRFQSSDGHRSVLKPPGHSYPSYTFYSTIRNVPQRNRRQAPPALPALHSDVYPPARLPPEQLPVQPEPRAPSRLQVALLQPDDAAAAAEPDQDPRQPVCGLPAARRGSRGAQVPMMCPSPPPSGFTGHSLASIRFHPRFRFRFRFPFHDPHERPRHANPAPRVRGAAGVEYGTIGAGAR
ncbi:hypothetical protein C8Q77DRAFT_544395 [Trametes polyzona]|nr:hypothetical protein C8Q77DRAFT_544395 [Trametes polyzona]